MDKFYIDSVEKAFRDHIADAARTRTTDRQTGLIAKEMTQNVLQAAFQRRYPELQWANGGLISRRTSTDPGALSNVWFEEDQTGLAEMMAPDAEDYPIADIKGNRKEAPIEDLGLALKFTTKELRTARFAGVGDLVTKKGASVRRGTDRKLDQLIKTGAPSQNLFGIYAYPGAALLNAVVGDWTAATPAQIISDFNTAFQTYRSKSNGVLGNNITVMFDNVTATHLKKTRMATDDPTKVWDELLSIYGDGQIVRMGVDYDLATADEAGTGPRVLFYENNPEVILAEIPLYLEGQPPVRTLRTTKIGFDTSFGGVICYQPDTILYLDGVGA